MHGQIAIPLWSNGVGRAANDTQFPNFVVVGEIAGSGCNRNSTVLCDNVARMRDQGLLKGSQRCGNSGYNSFNFVGEWTSGDRVRVDWNDDVGSGHSDVVRDGPHRSIRGNYHVRLTLVRHEQVNVQRSLILRTHINQGHTCVHFHIVLAN